MAPKDCNSQNKDCNSQTSSKPINEKYSFNVVFQTREVQDETIKLIKEMNK